MFSFSSFCNTRVHTIKAKESRGRDDREQEQESNGDMLPLTSRVLLHSYHGLSLVSSHSLASRASLSRSWKGNEIPWEVSFNDALAWSLLQEYGRLCLSPPPFKDLPFVIHLWLPVSSSCSCILILSLSPLLYSMLFHCRSTLKVRSKGFQEKVERPGEIRQLPETQERLRQDYSAKGLEHGQWRWM